MKVSTLRWLSLGLCVTGSLLLGMHLLRPVTVWVDGKPTSLRTWPGSVADLLARAGVWVRPEDAVFPPLDSPLSGQIFVRRAYPVWLQGETSKWHFTHRRIVGNIALEAGIRLFPGDKLWVDGVPRPADFLLPEKGTHALQVGPASLWVVHTPEGPRRIYQAAAGLADALWGAGFPLFNGDTFKPAPDALPSGSGETLGWQPSRKIQVQTHYGVVSGRVTAETVGEALAQIALPAQGLDYTLPPLDAPLPDDGKILLVRMREDVLVEQTPIPFEVQYQPLPEVEIGEIRILQAGQYGVQAQRIRVRLEDEVEVARTVEDTYLAQEPQARIVGYGTLAVPHTVNTPEGTLTYWRSAQVYVTSYSPCRLGIPNYCNYTTASGQRLRKGLVAVTRRMYAALAGSQVYVPGYGIGTVADIGAGVPGREWLDLGFEEDNFEPWHQTVTVYYLWPPPQDLTWLIP